MVPNCMHQSGYRSAWRRTRTRYRPEKPRTRGALRCGSNRISVRNSGHMPPFPQGEAQALCLAFFAAHDVFRADEFRAYLAQHGVRGARTWLRHYGQERQLWPIRPGLYASVRPRRTPAKTSWKPLPYPPGVPEWAPAVRARLWLPPRSRRTRFCPTTPRGKVTGAPITYGFTSSIQPAIPVRRCVCAARWFAVRARLPVYWRKEPCSTRRRWSVPSSNASRR